MHTGDTQFAHWLQWFCGGRTEQPFALGDGRVCGSDGRLAVICSDPTVAAAVMPLEGRLENVPEKIRTLLAEPMVKSKPMLFDQLVEMFSPHEPVMTEVCPHCHGKKRCRHVCDCELCEAEDEECPTCYATGVIDAYPADKRCLMFGVLFDWHRVSYLLAHVPPTLQCEVGIVGGEQATLRIVTDEWTAFVASMTRVDHLQQTPAELMDVVPV